jgi:hypothetical protein
MKTPKPINPKIVIAICLTLFFAQLALGIYAAANR